MLQAGIKIYIYNIVHLQIMVDAQATLAQLIFFKKW